MAETHAHVRARGARRAHALAFARLQHAQQLGLQAGRHVADLVQEEGAPVGHLEVAHAVGPGVGEGALHVAEQLALEHPLRDAARVHRDDRPRGAGGTGVDPARHHLLAGAVLARDQHVGVGRGHPLHQPPHGLHGARIADQLGEAVAAQPAVLLLEPLGRLQRAAQLHLRAQHRHQAGVVPRLLDVVAGAAAHGLHRALHAAPRRHHHDGKGGVHRVDAGQQVQPFLPRGGVAGVVQVQQQRVERLLGHGGGHRGRRGGGCDLEPLAAQQEPERLQDVGAVVGDQNARGRVGCHSGGSKGERPETPRGRGSAAPRLPGEATPARSRRLPARRSRSQRRRAVRSAPAHPRHRHPSSRFSVRCGSNFLKVDTPADHDDVLHLSGHVPAPRTMRRSAPSPSEPRS